MNDWWADGLIVGVAIIGVLALTDAGLWLTFWLRRLKRKGGHHAHRQ